MQAVGVRTASDAPVLNVRSRFSDRWKRTDDHVESLAFDEPADGQDDVGLLGRFGRAKEIAVDAGRNHRDLLVARPGASGEGCRVVAVAENSRGALQGALHEHAITKGSCWFQQIHAVTKRVEAGRQGNGEGRP